MKIFDDVAEWAKDLTSKALGQERVSQYKNPHPKNGFACFFTGIFMYFRTVKKIKMTWDKYRLACLKIGAINDSFRILDRSKMAAAAGFPNLVCKDTSTKIREKIFERLFLGQPVPFAIDGGTHFESVDGYETTDDGKILFLVDDPGTAGHTHLHSETLELLTIKNGTVKKTGRKVTRVYWFEEK